MRADHFLDIGYVSVKRIPCFCSGYLRKLSSPWSMSQDKYNKDRYKGANQNCVYWDILGYYNNWKIIYYIDSIEQHESTNTDKNVHIKQNNDAR